MESERERGEREEEERGGAADTTALRFTPPHIFIRVYIYYIYPTYERVNCFFFFVFVFFLTR